MDTTKKGNKKGGESGDRKQEFRRRAKCSLGGFGNLKEDHSNLTKSLV